MLGECWQWTLPSAGPCFPLSPILVIRGARSDTSLEARVRLISMSFCGWYGCTTWWGTYSYKNSINYFFSKFRWQLLSRVSTSKKKVWKWQFLNSNIKWQGPSQKAILVRIWWEANLLRGISFASASHSASHLHHIWFTSSSHLGILFNKYGNFDDQLKVKIAKCNKMCGYILRTFVTREPGPMMCLFKSLVIPIMDYGSIIWNPSKRKDIEAIEKIQRNFTKRLNNMSDFSYYDRLKHLKIYSMQRRRQRYEILYIFKILKHQVPNVGLKWKIFPRRGRELIPPSVRKNSKQSAVTMRRNSFRGNAAYVFNSIPVNLRNIDLDTSMETIKRTLDRYLSTVTDEPLLNGCTRSNDAATNSINHQRVRRFSLDLWYHHEAGRSKIAVSKHLFLVVISMQTRSVSQQNLFVGRPNF